ncbi:MAG TPA: glycosyltransferase family 39 protein [Candidatus Binataceae bacterium]|nr:glycosyltransferase family 39 protein [Candidatus Binataceae bacterium]
MITICLGAGLRTIALDRVPLGFNQDEACNGYDAYSLFTTAHDHRGNFLPIAIQAFNDYRMPLFDYSIGPLVGIFGLKPWIVRLGAALWGIADLIAIGLLCAELLDPSAAVVAVFLVAVSPWHLMLSRFGHEAITASATVDWAIAGFLVAINRRDQRWLTASAILFGLSLYSYSITKLFTPLIIVWIAILYRREIKPLARSAINSTKWFVLIVIPQLWLLIARGGTIQAHYRQMSVLSGENGIGRLAFNWLDHFSPSNLFGTGSSVFGAPHDLTLLFAGQAILSAIGFSALLSHQWRKEAIFLIGWLAAAAIPGAMIKPAPSLHPLHDILLVVPWAILSALGMVVLLSLRKATASVESEPVVPARPRLMRQAGPLIACVAILMVLVQASISAAYYFTGFSETRESFFQYGVKDLIDEAQKLAPPEVPIVMPLTINQPYIYVLFHNSYPPRAFYSKTAVGGEHLFGSVLAFDRYDFGDPWLGFKRLPHGVFVFPKTLVRPQDPMQPFSPAKETVTTFADPPAAPAATFHFGRDVYSIVVK